MIIQILTCEHPVAKSSFSRPCLYQEGKDRNNCQPKLCFLLSPLLVASFFHIITFLYVCAWLRYFCYTKAILKIQYNLTATSTCENGNHRMETFKLPTGYPQPRELIEQALVLQISSCVRLKVLMHKPLKNCGINSLKINPYARKNKGTGAMDFLKSVFFASDFFVSFKHQEPWLNSIAFIEGIDVIDVLLLYVCYHGIYL
jgi:hypothetical protein